jgi:organic radical activating enzyme
MTARFGEKREEVAACYDQIAGLKEQGLLFAPDTFEQMAGELKARTSGVVKALCLHVAHTCNLNCGYCFASQGKYHGERAVMSFEVGRQALDFLVAHSGSRRNLEVDFFGGEPLMNWQVVKDLVRYGRAQEKLHDKRFRFTLTTNGTLVNDEIMDFCNRGFLPSANEFRDKFETPIQKNANQAIAEHFKKITAPFMLRRMKTDKSIISDLPDKIQQNEYAELTRTQAALYKRTLDEFMKQLQLLEEGASLDINDDMLAAASGDMGMASSEGAGAHSLFKRKGLILQMILALKQICNHPRTFLKAGEAKVEDSGKLGMLLDLLKSIQEQGEKTIIFTQFREMGELLQETLERELEIKADFYHGGCTQNQRNEMVRKFQQKSETKVLILSLKAAGTGLNLTAASQVIHYDLWWNPAIEAQATDRAFRIGQTRNVQVHRFITKGTFEEKIDALLESKKAVAEMTVNAGETWLADMNDAQLGEIFALE